MRQLHILSISYGLTQGGELLDLYRGLTERERLFVDRVIKRKNLSLVFSLLSVIIAAIFLIYHLLILHDLNALRFVIVVLLLLSGRSHLRQYRSAVIFNKLKIQANSLNKGNKPDVG